MCQIIKLAYCESLHYFLCCSGKKLANSLNMDRFVEKYSQTLSELSRISAENHACIIWQGPVTKVGNYGLISYKDPDDSRWKKTRAHRLVYMINSGNINLPRDMDCSHLCHNSLCVKFDHISLEPHRINNNRKHCLNSNTCHGHVGFNNCLLDLKLR